MSKGRLQRLVARSVLSRSNPDLAAIHGHDIARIPNPVKRLAALTLHHAAVRCPDLAAYYAGLEPSTTADGFIGMGYDSVVLRQGQDVAKLHLLSLRMNRSGQRRYASEKDASYRALASTMSRFMVDQTVAVDFFPGSTAKEIVQTTQPFQQLTPVRLFRPNTNTVNRGAFEQITEQDSGIKEQLDDFVKQSFKLYDTEGLLPDVLGDGNLGLDEQNQLLLIDGYPLPPDNTTAVRNTTRQLQSVGELLTV